MDNKKKQGNKFIVLSIYLAYFIIIFCDMFNNFIKFKFFMNFLDIVSISIPFFLFLYILYIKRKNIMDYFNKNYILIIVFFVLSLLSCFLYKSNRPILKLSFLLLVAHELDFNKFIKFDLRSRILLVGIMLLLCVFGIQNNELLEIRNGFPRYNFGFEHPNNFSDWIFIILSDIYYISYITKNNKKLMYILPIFLSIMYLFFDYFYVGCRTNEILIILLMFGYIFIGLKKINFRIKLFNFLLINSFIILAAVSFLLSFYYNNDISFFSMLNKILSNRLFLSNWYLSHYKINILGNLFINNNYTLDNSYLNILLRFGILLFALFAIFYRNTIKKLIYKKNYFLPYIILLYLVHGICQITLYVVAKNPTLFLFASSNIKEKE